MKETHEPIKLITTADSQSWRERINKEVDTAGRLKHMLVKQEQARATAKAAPLPPMPVPPTAFAAMSAKLSSPCAQARAPCRARAMRIRPRMRDGTVLSCDPYMHFHQCFEYAQLYSRVSSGCAVRNVCVRSETRGGGAQHEGRLRRLAEHAL